MFINNSLEKNILRLVDKEEKHNSTSIISALDLLKLLRKRYILMQKILRPLVEALGKDFKIIDIYFVDNSSDDFAINVVYEKDDKVSYMFICQSDASGDIQVLLDTNPHNSLLIEKNGRLISEIFAIGQEEGFKEHTDIHSTTNLFSLSLHNNNYELSIREIRSLEDYFRLTYGFSMSHIETPNFLDFMQLVTGFKEVERVMSNQEKLRMFLEHVNIYEADVPKHLIKK